MRRTKILQEAKNLFSTKGIAKTSIQDIADGCKISKGAFYLEFESKNELINELLLYLNQELLEEMERIAKDDTLTPGERFQKQIAFQLTELYDQQHFTEALIQESGLQLEGDLLLVIRKIQVDYMTNFEPFISQLFPKAKPHEVREVASLISGVLAQFETFAVLEKVTYQVEEVAQYCLELSQSLLAFAQKCQPLLAPTLTQTRAGIEESWQFRTKSRVIREVDQMRTAVKKRKDSDREEWLGSLELFEQELQKEIPNKLMLQGLLANLKAAKFIKKERKKLADLLQIKVI